MTDEADKPGVPDLVAAMRGLKDDFDVDSIAVTQWLPDGHMLTFRIAGPVLEIERDDGVLVTIPPEDIPQ